jgi:putative DNA primase/helicase
MAGINDNSNPSTNSITEADARTAPEDPQRVQAREVQDLVPEPSTNASVNAPEQAGGAGVAKRTIVVAMKQLPEATRDAAAALVAVNDPPVLFERGGDVVALKVAGHGEPHLELVQIPDLQVHLAYAARWLEETEKGVKAVYPPGLVARDLLGRASAWAPPLEEIVRIPILGADWKLNLQPGYGRADKAYYAPNHGPLPAIHDAPSAEDLAAARGLLLEELLGDFPLVGKADVAGAVAAMLVPFVRGRIDGPTPMHLFDSPQPGTGKTMLADVLAIPALGREPTADTEITSGESLRKWMTAKALAGEPVVLIDNINAKLQGSALASALTKVAWSDRILGTSKMAQGEMRSLWLATGNNVVVSLEMARRIVRCRLDAKMEKPYLRVGFRHANLRAWAKAHREELIGAILTLIQAWLAACRPAGKAVLGSYESYCATLGGILEVAGIEGFLSNLADDHPQADEETSAWAAFVAGWWEQFQNREVGGEDLDEKVLTPNPEMLATALSKAGTPRGRRIKLAQELAKRRESILAGKRLCVSDAVDRHGCRRYHLESVPPPGAAGEPETGGAVA